jgi:phenazine biosynthesis protein phzE
VTAPAERDLLDQILTEQISAFALISRPESGTPGMLDVLVGEMSEVESSLLEIPLADDVAGWDVLTVVPYRHLAERGFEAPDDGTPLLVMTIGDQAQLPVADALDRLPNAPTAAVGGHFNLDDDAYADLVRRVVGDEIGEGVGANFVIKRSFLADISDWSPQAALSFFRRLLLREQRAYWTFIIWDGKRSLIGATPERHISLREGTAVMNPISGTYRYPSSGPTLEGVLDFLADRKEADELLMVVDEELKMMARICSAGGRILGPALKEMKCLAHTEYLIEGKTDLDVREILRETMFAPTVMGSPLESAARVIARYEPQGRRYYSGLVALIGRGPQGDRQLDSSILIRTAEIDAGGRMRIDVGATLVRNSDPLAEAAETRAKLASLLDALEPTPVATGFATHPEVRVALARRNESLADFWIGKRDSLGSKVPALSNASALIIDAEDTFTAMLAAQLESLGLAVEVRRFDEPYDVGSYDLIVLGPGPGDPRVGGHPKIAHLRSALADALEAQRPLLAVCLSHQVLSIRLGLELRRLQPPNQGLAREVDLFGVPERVGFYNTFSAFCNKDKIEVDGIGSVEVGQDAETGEVYALRGPRFASMQFHPESVLTADGPRLLADAIEWALDR